MKNIIIGIVGLGIVVGGYFVFTNKNVEKNGEEVKTETSGKKMAFEAFLKNDSGAYVCTVNQYVGDVESKGTVYISNAETMSERNIRGEFKTSVQGMNVDSTFIMKDGFSYTWSSMMPNMGYKVKVEEGKTGDTNTQTSGTYSFDATQIGDYDCKEWIVEPGKFTLPSSVKFTDLNTSTSQVLPKTTTSAPAPTPKTTTTTETKTTTTSNTTTTSTQKTFTLAEVSAHSSKTSCYTTMNGKVYDITSYIPRHPGGEREIMQVCGKNGSSLFEDQHGGQSKPNNILKSFEIGTLI
ncbi:MAG: hypothetical protein QG585_491 [Patescibacteria group bacterium]|jgi:cytochrome b involved in lipid metabolism/uncharacterized protein YxeA|nr:hypothetical protein [Patescibacteria group bacterium]